MLYAGISAEFMTQLFKIENVFFSRTNVTNETAILIDISLEIPCGLHVITGPSGSGKSTFLKLLNRLISPQQGKISYLGNDIKTIPVTELRRRIGMMFQLPALPEKSVRDNIQYGPRLADLQLSTTQLESILVKVGLEPSLLERTAQELSVGQQQRVALARVLANKPEVLLLDEPTASLDPDSSMRIEKSIMELVENEKLSVLWVSHDATLAARLGCPRIHINERRVQCVI